MSRNPSWRKEELVLALDLYMQHRGSLPAQGSEEVAELSRTLNRLASTLGLIAGDERFRNEAGVHMKLMNFLPHDPLYQGTGLRFGGRLDNEVWEEFADRPDELRQAAAVIRRRLGRVSAPKMRYDSSTTWREAVLRSLRRFAKRHRTRKISRQHLLHEERERILNNTRTRGTTPDQTVSRVLQELRDDGVLYFLGRGTYLLLDTPLDVETEELSDRALDFAASRNKLRVGAVAASTEEALGRRRKGQDRVRSHALQNYGGTCAFCDVTDERLLVAGHISRWADDPKGRGNLANVICMCRFHDALFETGYLALSDDLGVLRGDSGGSSAIAQNLDSVMGFRSPTHYPPDAKFLQKHRDRVRPLGRLPGVSR